MSSQLRVSSRLAVTVIAGGVFASVASIPMLLLASEELVHDFGVSYADLQWRNLLFWTAFGVGLPLFGRITERANPKRLFLSGLAVFLISAVIGALTHSWLLFLVSSWLQGIADAIVVSTQAVLIRALLPKDRTGWAFGWQGAVLAFAQLGSPVLGGFLLEYTSWRAIFWLVASLGVTVAVAALVVLPHDDSRDVAQLNSNGILPFRSTTFLMVAVASGQAIVLVSGNWRMIATGIAVLSLTLFILSERRTPAIFRYIPIDIFKNRLFFFTSMRGLLIYFPLNAVAMFLPIYLTVSNDWDTGLAGIVLLIDAAVVTAFGGKAGRFADKRPRVVVRSGFVCLAFSAVILAAGADLITGVCISLVFVGAGAALTVPGQSKIALSATPESETGTYMSIFQSAQFVSIGLATVVFAPLMQGRDAQSLSSSGFTVLCIICGILFVVGAFSVRRDGGRYGSHKPSKSLTPAGD